MKVRSLVPVFLLAAACVAQKEVTIKAPAAKLPMFTLAAGDHDVRDLVELLAQIRKTRIDCDKEELEQTADRRIRLQRELRLDADAWDDVATTLLMTRDFVIAVNPETKLTELVSSRGPRAKLLRKWAEPREPGEVLAHPNRIAVVKSYHACETCDPAFAMAMLRPTFGAPGEVLPPLLEDDGRKVFITGLTDKVAVMLRLARACDGLRPEPAAARTGPRFPDKGALAWPAGRTPLKEFLDRTAVSLGANVLWRETALPDGAAVESAQARELDADGWHREATRALRKLDLVLVPIDEVHRVYEVVPITAPLASNTWWRRARWVRAEDVRADGAVEPVSVQMELRHVAPGAMVENIRQMRGRASMVALSVVQKGNELIVGGLSDEVAEVLETVRKLDVPAQK